MYCEQSIPDGQKKKEKAKFESIVCSHSKVTKVYSKISLMKSSENDFIFSSAFYLIMCLMKAKKNFQKIVISKTRELVSF